MSKKTRPNYRPEEKQSILKEHLVEGRPVSEVEGRPVSEVYGRHVVQPSMFYYW